MKFAIVGDDPLLVPLARAATAEGHDLAQVSEAADLATQLAEWVPAKSLVDQPWEALLDVQVADFVLVGRTHDEDQRAEQLRKMVQAGTPLLVVHPVCLSMLLYFELGMIRDESRAVLRHYVPGRCHPALAQMAELVHAGEDGELGRIEQAVVERAMSSRTREDVLAALAGDVDRIAVVGGQVETVSALGLPEGAEAFSNLGVQMLTATGIAVRWSAEPVEEMAGGRLVLIGPRGKAVLSMPQDTRDWSLDVPGRASATPQTGEPSDDPRENVRRLVAAIEGGDAGEDWTDASHSLEAVDAAERSFEKGKTITLYHEEHSEQTTFKAMMAAVGCGLLIGGLLLVVAASAMGFVGESLGLPTELLGYWPILLLALLALFLFLQLLPKVVFSEERRRAKQRK